MKGTLAHRRRALAAVLGVASLSGLVLVGCRPGGGIPWRTTTTQWQPTTTWGTTPTTDCHGHTEHDHSNLTSTTMGHDHGHGGHDDHHAPGNTFPPCNSTTTRPGQTTTTHGDHGGGGHDHEVPPRLNHPPSAAQQAWSRDLVAYTKWALAQIPNKAAASRLGYNDIGDGQHYTHAGYRVDGKELDPRAIESLVFDRLTGQVEAAMYNMERSTTLNNVADWAGNWTVWHGHDTLCWAAPEDQPGWTRLGGVKINGRCTAGSYAHTPVLMLHVWVKATPESNRCGAFASIEGLGPGSCVNTFQPASIPARTPPPYGRTGTNTFPGSPRT